MPALLLEASELKELLLKQENPDLILVDLGTEERFSGQHIPGARLVTPAQTQAGPPVPGLCPSIEKVTQMMRSIGLSEDSHVVVYDDEGGGWAGRFIWLLDEIGHVNYSYLNGGLHAWASGGHSMESGMIGSESSSIEITLSGEHSVQMEDILPLLSSGELQIWDARSPMEYRGESVYAARGGHIPSALNYEWTNAMDRQNSLRLKPLSVIETELASVGITKDKFTITHCQTHHRSGLTYLIAKLLGFNSIKAYPGSWGEWGNHPTTPIS